MLILIYNRMFGAPPKLDQLTVPADIEFTEDRRRLGEARVVVFHLPSLHRLFLPRKPAGQVWVAWYMECEQHYRRLRSARFMQQFELKMCHRQDADVMVSYAPPELRGLYPTPLPEVHHLHLACSFVSGRADRSGRGAYLKELARHIEVHQYGKRGNRTIPGDQGRVTKLKTLSSYRFTLAFENAIAPDYVTEKLYEPLLAGSVPIYLGAPNVAEFAPEEGCYINTADFSGPAQLADYLLQLNRDETAYARYLNWRQRPLSDQFKALCQRTNRSGMQRLCDLMSARQAGWGLPVCG
jgi:hypothetical protein